MDGRIGGPPGQGGALPPGQARKADPQPAAPPVDDAVPLTGDQSAFGRRGASRSSLQETSTLYNAAMPWDLIDQIFEEDEEAADLPPEDADPVPTRTADRPPSPAPAPVAAPRETVRASEPAPAPAETRQADPEPADAMPWEAEPPPTPTPAPQTARPAAAPPAQPAAVRPPEPTTAPPPPAPAPAPTPRAPSPPVTQPTVAQTTVPQAAPAPVPAQAPKAASSTPAPLPPPPVAPPLASPQPAAAPKAPLPKVLETAEGLPEAESPETPSKPATGRPRTTTAPALRQAVTGNLDPTVLLRFKHRELADALKLQLTDPENIIQVSGKATCCAATLQRALVKLDPKLYAAIASDLILNNLATLPNGQALKLTPANPAWIEAQNLPPREKLNAMVQTALMDLADPDGHFDLAQDGFAHRENQPRGLTIDQAKRLNELLLQAPTLDPRELRSKVNEFLKSQPLDLLDDDPHLPQGLVKDLLRSASEQATFAIVRARDPEGRVLVDDEGKPLVEEPDDEPPLKRSHMVMIIDVDHEANTVTIIDAIGKQRTLARDKFAQLMVMSNKWDDLQGIGSPDGLPDLD